MILINIEPARHSIQNEYHKSSKTDIKREA